MPDPETALFEAADLACVRGGRLVFEQLSFTLGAGDALVLRGANGSGKSSLLRLLAGFLRPSEGRLAWAGASVLDDLTEHRTRLHYVGHADAIKTALTARENLQFAASLTGTGGDVVEAALARFDLLPHAEASVRFLSAGQRRRLALARLVAAERRLWLLDEPGVGLDRANRRHLEAAIREHRGTGGLCVLATHGDVAVEDGLLLDFDA